MYKKGKSAHAAAPSLGINAGVAAAKELAQVRLAPEIDDMMRFIADYIGDETQGKGLGIDYTDEETGCVSVNLGILGIREGPWHSDAYGVSSCRRQAPHRTLLRSAP